MNIHTGIYVMVIKDMRICQNSGLILREQKFSLTFFIDWKLISQWLWLAIWFCFGFRACPIDAWFYCFSWKIQVNFLHKLQTVSKRRLIHRKDRQMTVAFFDSLSIFSRPIKWPCVCFHYNFLPGQYLFWIKWWAVSSRFYGMHFRPLLAVIFREETKKSIHFPF